MKFNPQANPILSLDLKNFVKPKLAEILEREKQVGRDNKGLLFNLSEKVERLKISLMKSRGDQQDLLNELKQCAMRYDELKAIGEEEMKRYNEEKMRIMSEIDVMGDDEKRYNAEEAKMYKMKQIVEENKCKYKLEQEKLYTTMMDIVEWIMSHKESVRGKLNDLQVYLESQDVDM